VTYHLNPRAVWGDRAPVTAADFAATWQACLDPGRACATGRGFDAVVAVEEGATAGDVVVTYDRVYPEWALTFQDGPVRAEAAGEVWRDPSEHPEWAAGPYKVAFLDQSARELTLERNPNWWGDRGLLAEVDVEQVTAEALAAAVAAEELDAWPIESDARRHQAAAALSGVQLRRADSATWRVLLVGQSGALADSRVRRAVRLGLDRALIGSADLPGVGWDARPLNHLFWQPGQDSYTDLTDGVATDLTQAGALLDAAGFQVRADASRAVELRFLVNPADPLSEGEGLQVAAQLRALGVGVTLVYPEHGWPEGRVCATGCAIAPGGYADALAGGGVDLVAQAWTNELQPEVTWGAWLASNPLGHSNAVVEQLLATVAVTANAAGRAWRLDVAAASLWADTTVIPLYVVPETWAVRSDLANFGPSGLATLRWQDVGLV
jgi:peptide/nickel transport system substrate-binding protein